ncbi:hypothetical protein MGU_02432 [Metarhizium guizhouense ARSEF 977]|uniref:Centrosomin N-terminal motif 1 domain-containing protein n=1 Tax=Metarhizium guizhouense (strain ARSEF 977) TaxID=1276136 RepID=A0A0B4GT38_METGA|nr:hypothetical protein MGU_02432 [Metarhizium guizhouense ARSEF 977]
MDGAQSQARQRAHPRAPSRSSIHTNASRTTPVSPNSSTSQIAISPQLSQSHPMHRYHHSRCGTGSPQPMSRPTPPLSRQESIESTRQIALSSFLQEKLQKERRAESEKLNQSQSSLPRSNPDMSVSADLGRTPSSPFKTSMEGNRPQSSAGTDQGKKKGLGVKEMEKVISNLHKQNFDLKLELYHRRERQTTLEERVDAMESDRQRMEEVNDKLLIELEKRDKAVEEAVAMIVTLEAKVDQLFRERAMVQRIENEGFFCPRDYDNMGYKTPVPHSTGPDIMRMEEDAKVVNRMPSFLSDHSETTQNLRNVYLGTQASMLSLTRVTEGSPETDHVQALGSPTLSVLSESSFVSVYGRKDKVMDADQIAADVDETLVLDGADSSCTKEANGEQPSRNHCRSVSSSKRADSRASSTGHFQSITDVITGSPLQRLEQLDTSYGAKRESGHHPRSQIKDYSKGQLLPDKKPFGLKSIKQDKHDALRRVTTEGQGGVRLHDQALPPTPDTTSSSMLRRFKDSNDTLSQQDLNEENSNGVALNHLGAQGGSQCNHQLAAVPNGLPEEADSWASPSKRAIDLLFEHRGPPIPRPRSADESTASHRRGKGWDSDDDDSDAHSLQSSLDIWMRESAQPSRNRSRASPDLFSFPTDSSKGGWAMSSTFKQNSDLADNAPLPPGFDYMRDLFSVRQGLFAGTAPPPPNRRSSLHARTGSTPEPATSQGANNQGVDQGPPSTARRRSYHSRQNSVDLGKRDDMRTPVQRDQFASPPQPNSDQKPKHYPPIAGQQHGGRTGLNRLFRRSTSGAPPGPSSEQSNPVEPAVSEQSKHFPTIGIPSWASRHSAVEDDRSGATPPPIMLNPRQGRRHTMGAEGETEKSPAQDLSRSMTPGPTLAAAAPASAPSTDIENSPAAAAAASSGRRRWLPGFARTNNLKNKAG